MASFRFLILFLLAGLSSALAVEPDEGSAYAAAWAFLDSRDQWCQTSYGAAHPNTHAVVVTPPYRSADSGSFSWISYEFQCQLSWGLGGGGPGAIAFVRGATCDTRQDETGWRSGIDPETGNDYTVVCHTGCQYVGFLDFGPGSPTVSGHRPSGQTCKGGTEPRTIFDPPPDFEPSEPDEPPSYDDPPTPPGGDPSDTGTGATNEHLGPKLDAIAEAIRQTRNAVDRADSNNVDAINNAASQLHAATHQAASNNAALIGHRIDGVTAAIQALGDRLDKGDGGDGDGDGDGSGSCADHSCIDQDDGDLESIFEFEDGADLVDRLDDSGFGLARACPAYGWPNLNLPGVDLTVSWNFLCDVTGILGALIWFMGFVTAGYIVARIG